MQVHRGHTKRDVSAYARPRPTVKAELLGGNTADYSGIRTLGLYTKAEMQITYEMMSSDPKNIDTANVEVVLC